LFSSLFFLFYFLLLLLLLAVLQMEPSQKLQKKRGRPRAPPEKEARDVRLEKKSLKQDGYFVLRQYNNSQKQPLDAGTCSQLSELVLDAYGKHGDTFQELFQRFEVQDDGIYATIADLKRVQIPLNTLKELYTTPEHLGLFEKIQLFTEKCVALVASSNRNAEYVVPEDSIQFLLSLENGEPQCLHTDYTVETASEMEKSCPGSPPLFFLCPLSPSGCKLTVAKGAIGKIMDCTRGNNLGFFFSSAVQYDLKDISLKFLDVMVGHGYLPHAGCAYEQINLRLHFYMYPKKCYEHIVAAKLPQMTGTLFETQFTKAKFN
jgi:hypothetical protein